MAAESNTLARNVLNQHRFFAGGLVAMPSPHVLLFYLDCLRELTPCTPTPEDVKVLADILYVLRSIDPKENAKRKAVQRIRKVAHFMGDAVQVQLLLETLGYCGILETPEHGGMLHRYVDLGTAPTSSRSSDWRYPVDFWRGEHGFNKEGLDFWFRPYISAIEPSPIDVE